MKLFYACAALILLFGCQPAEQPAAETGPIEATDTVTQTATTDTTATGATATEASTSAAIAVTLTDFRIDMPASLPAGPTRFDVTNSGKVEHSFEIEGQGIEEELQSNLKPGETGTLEVDLKPGTYRVYCPVKDHGTRRGMSLQLTVS